MKIFAIDYGDTRSGMAVSDEGEKFAFAAGCITEHNVEKAAQKIAKEIEQSGAKKIVIGLPKNMDGSEGFRAQKTRKFADCLSALLPHIPVAFYDERLTTKSATYYLNQGNIRGKQRKQLIDALSAEIILQNYLDNQ